MLQEDRDATRDQMPSHEECLLTQTTEPLTTGSTAANSFQWPDYLTRAVGAAVLNAVDKIFDHGLSMFLQSEQQDKQLTQILQQVITVSLQHKLL